ncbi:hypothetical protein F383_19569 [Gossypium arboreum]|uniref:Uncharacterized protein n=1 Tax=Gossypium arboreum TaxID=29729 RepID=A0A0B0NLF6_GOSAR|nr:hypothetical protein F383_19569 [Gossypium arboreum]
MIQSSGAQWVKEAVDGRFGATGVESWAPCVPRVHMEA